MNDNKQLTTAKPLETQEGLFIMKWRSFVPMIIGIILSTNTVSIFYQKQQRHDEELLHQAALIEYNKERADRIAERKSMEAKAYYDNMILKLELQKCKNSL